jgi:hypothetical protein
MLNLLKKLFGGSTATTDAPAVPYKLEVPVVESKVETVPVKSTPAKIKAQPKAKAKAPAKPRTKKSK